MKNCKKCREQKPMEDFLPCSIRKDGKGNICSNCRSKTRKITSGGYGRSLLKKLNTVQKNRKPTPKQERRKKEEALYQKVRKKMLDNMFEAYGFYFCELSNETIPERGLAEVHHIRYRSQEFDLEILHSERNLIILSKSMHAYLHANPKENALLVRERYLEKG